MDTLASFLNAAGWYRALALNHQKLVLSKAQLREIAAGDCLAHAGDPSEHWYGVLRGLLQMYVVGAEGDATTLFCLQQDEWGGDGSLLKNEPMRYDLRALVPSLVCLVPKPVFDGLRRESIIFNQHLSEIMNRRMGAFVGMLAATRLLGPEARVARALMMVTRSSAEVEQLNLAQHELGRIAGLSRQRVNQAISALRHQQVVLSEAKAPYLIVDRKRLQMFLAGAS